MYILWSGGICQHSTHTCTHTRMHTYTHMHVRTHADMQTHTHTHTHTHTSRYSNTVVVVIPLEYDMGGMTTDMCKNVIAYFTQCLLSSKACSLMIRVTSHTLHYLHPTQLIQLCMYNRVGKRRLWQGMMGYDKVGWNVGQCPVNGSDWDEQSSVGCGRMYDTVQYGRMAEHSSVGRKRLCQDVEDG